MGTDEVLALIADSTTARLNAGVITVSGTVPTLNTITQVIAQVASGLFIEQMDDGRWALGYTYNLVANRQVISIATVTGTSVTIDESYQYRFGQGGPTVWAFENIGNNEFAALYRKSTIIPEGLRIQVFKYDPPSKGWQRGQHYEITTENVNRASMAKVSDTRMIVVWVSNADQKVYGQWFDLVGMVEPIPSTKFVLTTMTDPNGNHPSSNYLGGRIFTSWTEGGPSTPNDYDKRVRIVHPGNPAVQNPELKRYWRIQSTTNLDVGYSISELEFFYNGSWQSLVGKTLINIGSIENPTFPITKVNDGVFDPPNATSIFNVQDPGSATMDFIVDLGVDTDVTKVGIYPQAVDATSIFNRLDNLFVYSGYPGNWTLENSFTSIGTGWSGFGGFRREFVL